MKNDAGIRQLRANMARSPTGANSIRRAATAPILPSAAGGRGTAQRREEGPDPKADKRFEKTGKKAEKTGARLEAAKERLAAQRPVKRPAR